MITRVIFIGFCFVLIAPTKSAGTEQSIDCKSVDQQRFKELFVFKFGGGSKGLFLDFDFVSKDKATFKFENCEFLLKETRVLVAGAKSYKKQGDKKKLVNLKPCSKYDVILVIQNLATKKEFNYTNSVFTKLDTQNKLVLKVDKVENDSVNLSWNSEQLLCVINFKLSVKNKKNEIVFEEENVKDGSVVVGNLSACDVYSAQVFADTGRSEKMKSAEQSFILKSDKTVEDLQLKIDELSSNEVSLSWTSNSLACMLEYKLNLRDSDNKIIYAASVFTNKAVISSLASCSNYSVELIVLDDEKSVVKAVNKTFITHSTPIDSLEIKASGTRVKVSWTPPQRLDCVISYNISYNIENCNFQIDDNISCFHTETVDKNSKSVSLTSLPLAERFSLMLYVNDLTFVDVRLAKNITFSTIDYEKFFVQNINEFRKENAELQLRWSLERYFSTILKHFEVFFDDKVIKTAKTSTILNIAACKQNYTVAIRCVSFDGVYGPNVSYQTNLHDDDVQLSSLQNKIAYEQVNSSVFISWTPSEEEQPCISYYEIDFNDQNFKTEKTTTEINEFVPCITQAIDITPFSYGGKRGISATFEFTTHELAPNPPTSFKLVDAASHELVMSATISENDRNCASSAIEFKCDEHLIAVDVPGPSDTYVAKLTGLSPFRKYNCTSRVINNVGASQSTEVKSFSTKQDGPQPPTGLKHLISDGGHVVVMWTADNSTGLADKFKVVVLLEASFDENLSKDCGHRLNGESTKFYPTENKISLTALQDFSKYSVRVAALNSYGVSEYTKKLYINTKSAAPSAPRSLSISFEPSISEEKEVLGVLTWSPPCRLNGKFSLYMISLDGSRPGLQEHSIMEATTFQNMTLDDLRRGYKYEAKVKAVNLDFAGTYANFSFRAPSGIPQEENLKSWTTLGSNGRAIKDGKVELFLRRRMLVSDIGDITGIAFLIFPSNCDETPRPTFGYISSHHQALPSAHLAESNFECSTLYQQTEILPNPIDPEQRQENLDDYNLKFTLGDERCSYFGGENQYCNGPLSSEQSYGVIARVFTSDGFRDTEPAFIEAVSSPLKLISSNFIVYSAISALVVSSLVAVLCCACCCRKKKKILKAKEAAEADENLLSFTSYCVFDRAPTLKKVYNE